MNKRISVIVPAYNSAGTIGKCLEALFSSPCDDFEVIVVDDCSSDGSHEIVRQFPCKLIRLEERSGAARARNIGAQNSCGKVLFFIDSDCVVQENTLSVLERTFDAAEEVVLGGSYTMVPFDDRFFSTFQSVFIHYSETKRKDPDYVASHAMAIGKDLFEKSGGFPEDFMPIIEDVEFSHRLRRAGTILRMEPAMLVRHIFNFTLSKSLRNAFRKSKYWTAYSLKNRDLLNDSGTASRELKTNVVSCLLVLCIILMSFFFRGSVVLPAVLPILGLNIYVNRNFLALLRDAKGLAFAVSAAVYYMAVYPLPVCAGSLSGAARYYLRLGDLRGVR